MARVTATDLPRGVAGAAVGCGLLDAGANVFYVLALDRGLLSVVSVFTALYPAGTVLLARYVLGEHLSAVQRAGLGVAGAAAVLIAL
jgi:drug/metabolite transporter (DMT)-like permease